MTSDDEIKEIIADAEDKIGDYHAIILSKQVLISALKELLQYRSLIDLNDTEYLPTS